MTTCVAEPGHATVCVRAAHEGDIAAVLQLVNGFAAERVMLPRTAESVEDSLHSFVVVVDDADAVLACGALKEYSPSLAEVASVAVSEHAHGLGLGRMIVAAVEDLAVQRGIGELFALTLTPGFFERLGYAVTDRAFYPEKIRRDCVGCLRREACAEVCVARYVSESSVHLEWPHPELIAA
ncbi:MAG TPA: GNAT family N-acetyltransferase [Gemmatimonadales bacterium]|nr:GNAT family N-acetyltransferase [Gemmatimonadales bacterium]